MAPGIAKLFSLPFFCFDPWSFQAGKLPAASWYMFTKWTISIYQSINKLTAILTDCIRLSVMVCLWGSPRLWNKCTVLERQWAVPTSSKQAAPSCKGEFSLLLKSFHSEACGGAAFLSVKPSSQSVEKLSCWTPCSCLAAGLMLPLRKQLSVFSLCTYLCIWLHLQRQFLVILCLSALWLAAFTICRSGTEDNYPGEIVSTKLRL